ncbi:protoporphyrinogen/coproporphyrinogen oxidase [Nocardia sp. NPDC058658]|uniref:protoporphyrinogen/coproporphyrinogen oxidase n=1 Tax=Nocardia sp. NPDC058658 TaxID=3346580 RepID=UPI003647DB13
MTGERRVAVVGGGMAGAAAARGLAADGVDVTLYEGGDRLGGRIDSVALPGGHVLEMGAVFLMNSYRDVNRAAGVLWPDRPVHTKRPITYIREGTRVTVPGELPAALMRLPWLSLRDRMRLVAEMARLRGQSKGSYDVHGLAELDHGTMGDWAADRLSPRIHHGLLRPVFEPFLFASCDRTSQALAVGHLNGPPVIRYSVVPRGLSRICSEIVADVAVRLDSRVEALRFDSKVTVRLADFSEEEFDAVVLAAGVDSSRGLIASLPEDVVPAQTRVVLDRTETVGLVHVAFLTGDLPATATGIFVPAEDGPIDIRLVASNRRMWPNREWPDGVDVVSVYFDAALFDELCGLSDDVIAARAWTGARELSPDLPPVAQLLAVRRWRSAAAVCAPGHLGRVAAELSGPDARLTVAGDYLSTGGLEGAYRAGTLAARKVLRFLDS